MKSANKIRPIFAFAMIAGVLVLAACSMGSPGSVNPVPPATSQHFPQSLFQSSPTPPPPPPAPTPTPIVLSYGQVIGTKTFSPGDTAAGGNGQLVDGINCGAMSTKFHIHTHVSIWHNGQQVAFPIALGIPGFVLSHSGREANSGRCFYHLHTHDMSGIVHIEAPDSTITYTLGQAFDIWGEPLSVGNVAGFMGPTLVYVDTNERTKQATIYNGDPRAIVLTNHEQITIEVGTPFVYPFFYRWPY